ncbi:MAG: PilN domain-containing protein [Gammaproteobacteria bacterium]|nr:PilN domain-containing protein [Gammaproteobacteria bacterium]
MPRINLLPWREELRKKRQQDFVVALAFTVLLGGAIAFGGKVHVDQLVSHQEARNEFLRGEIRMVDKKIEEIKELQATKNRLIARMQIIEQLQKSRPQVVHLFDELVRTLPNGVYLDRATQNGNTIELQGAAESNARVAAYMRNLDESDWLKDPMLGGIESRDQGRLRRGQFTLTVKQEVPGADEQEGEDL